jgi:ADP-ribosylglycohydrolase
VEQVKFVEVFHRDPREGYAGSFHSFLKETTNGDDFLANIRPHSDKSGAAMRASPLGVLPEIWTVIDYAEVQAKITHDTPDGIHAAQAAALMTHYFLYELGPKEKLGQFIASVVPGQWADEWSGKVGSKGWMSTRAAITAVQRCNSLSDLLKDCVGFSGDVDTVATIACAAASCCVEYQKDLPDRLLNELENETYGREYLEKLDQRLLALVGK